MTRTGKLVALLTTVTLVGAACTSKDESTTGAKRELRVAFMGAITGEFAGLVVPSQQAAKLAIDQANAKGDLPVKLTLDAQDTGADPDKAAAIAQALVADDTLLAVIGPAFSGESVGAGAIFETASVPRVTPSATNPGLAQQGWTHWFRALANDFVQGAAAADVLLTFLKANKVFIGHDKSAYGEGLATIVRDGLEARKASALAGIEGVDPGRKDYGRLASKIVASKADAFYWGGHSPEAIKILKQARADGFKGTFVGADDLRKDDSFLRQSAPANRGSVVTCPCVDILAAAKTDPAAKRFVADYKAAFGADPGIYSGESYDAVTLLLDAIKKAGVPGDDIKAYRETVTQNIAATSGLRGLTKTYEFQPNGDLVETAAATYLYKVGKGAFTLLGRADELTR